MTLTDKAKELFEEWYILYLLVKRNDYHKYPNEVILRKFYREIDAMKWGVYQDFFESQRLLINVKISFTKPKPYRGEIYEVLPETDRFDLSMKLNCDYSDKFTAREMVVERANELLNNN